MTATPTGRRRYRAVKRFLRHPRVVLQIEEVVTHIYVHNNPYVMDESISRTEWRDARPEDITVFEKAG